MFNISKKIVIVEIEDPKTTGYFHYLLNKYLYQKFLGDVGESFLTNNIFKKIILDLFKDKAKINFSNFKNIMDNYMIAEIIKVEI